MLIAGLCVLFRNGIGKTSLLKQIAFREVGQVFVLGDQGLELTSCLLFRLLSRAHRSVAELSQQRPDHFAVGSEHVSILYVDQEAHGDDTPAIQCVLSADVWREKFLRDEADINKILSDESIDDKAKDAAAEKLGEVHRM